MYICIREPRTVYFFNGQYRTKIIKHYFDARISYTIGSEHKNDLILNRIHTKHNAH